MSRATWDSSRSLRDFGYGPVTLFGAVFHRLLLSVLVPRRGPATPADKSAGLGFSPFARHYLGNHCCLLFLQVLRCFTSLGWRRNPMDSGPVGGALPPPGFPIRTPPDQSVFAAPRSFSQLAASFFACRCQGIRHAPFVSWPNYYSFADDGATKID